MRSTPERRPGRGIRAAIVIALFALGGAIAARAQMFEYVYGQNDRIEGFARRVSQIRKCATVGGNVDGFIAVGTTHAIDGDPNGYDVHVERTLPNGARVWEITYDIGNAGNPDFGTAIVQLSDASGFIVTGGTFRKGSGLDIFLLKIDCDGAVLWTKVYDGGGDEYANDLIQAFPIPNANSNVYDLVVAGTTTSANTTEDAYILRTDSKGTLLWDAAYDPPSRGTFS